MTVPDDPGVRYRAVLVAFAEQLGAAKPARHDLAPTPPLPRSRGQADLTGVVHAAAEMALVVYPGPVGELVSREIRAYEEIGPRLGGDALINRLITHLVPPTEGTHP